MTLADQIKQTRTPQEALMLLAQAIDDLRADVAAAHDAADLWEQPLQWTSDVAEHAKPLGQRIAEIERIQALLTETHDADDRQALEAQLRLLKDSGAAIEPAVPEGKRVVEAEGMHAGSPMQAIQVGGNVVHLPVVSKGRQVARAEWARACRIWEFIELDEVTAVDAYAEGGPMWLYLGAREAVMQMPLNWRVDLVEEIEKDSPAQAQEVARDILKSEESIDQKSAVEHIQRLSGNR